MQNMQGDFDPTTVKRINDLGTILKPILAKYSNEKIFILLDVNTEKHCYKILEDNLSETNFNKIVIEPGEKNKSLNTVDRIWEELILNNANKNSLLINLGGGILTDIGGFVASTYKRGMNFINIPTTIMAQVDAAIGGKNGINFSGFKNQIGLIQQPEFVLIYPDFLNTLDKQNYLSGFAEIIKYGLISKEFNIDELYSFNPVSDSVKKISAFISKSIEVKSFFVEKDPYENNIRKALNFGHNFAHAFEALYAKKEEELLHGFAVAAGLICELYLSHLKLNFPVAKVDRLANYILMIYGQLRFLKNDFDFLIKAMKQDKKNIGDNLIFTLIDNNDDVKINQVCNQKDILEGLDYYLSL